MQVSLNSTDVVHQWYLIVWLVYYKPHAIGNNFMSEDNHKTEQVGGY